MLVSYTFEIDDKIKERIEKIADKENRTLAGQIRTILEKYLQEI